MAQEFYGSFTSAMERCPVTSSLLPEHQHRIRALGQQITRVIPILLWRIGVSHRMPVHEGVEKGVEQGQFVHFLGNFFDGVKVAHLVNQAPIH